MGIGLGFDPLGIVAASASPAAPLTLVTSVAPFVFFSADMGITLDTGVSAWADQSGNGFNASQATAGSQPLLVTGDADFGGRNSVLADGTDDFLDSAWDPPAPNAQPVWFFFVFKQVTWSASRFLWGGSTGASVLCLFQTGTEPSMKMGNTTLVNENAGATVGSAVRGQVYFSGSTSDYIKLGSSLVTGASAGVNNATLLRLFSRNGSTQSINAKLACFGAWAGEPTADERAALDAWVTSYYGPTVVV